jgi:DNA-binding HxlR family transcriptional regulator
MLEDMDRDTDRRRRERYFELLREQSPADRLRKAGMLTQAVRQLAEAGIRQSFPQADPTEVKVRLTVRLYGREVARRLFGSHPALLP